MKFDLHLHTTASDGTDTPAELVALAARQGFEVIAVTDHDTLSGVEEAIQAGKRLGVRVIAGVEISACSEAEVHVLGYGIRRREALEDTLERMRAQRARRMEEMVLRLNEIGVCVQLSQVTGLARESVGRSHLARVLVENGAVRDVREAFNKYLSPGRPAYVERKKLSVAQAIALIESSGGLAVIAHPGQNRGDAFWMKERFQAYKAMGLRGIEAYHMAHSQQQAATFWRIARELDLLVTGGSDYHGTIKNVAMGDGMQYWRTRDADFEAFMRAMDISEES